MNNSINNLSTTTELKTYFVETHELDIDTNKLIQMEYFGYVSGVYGIVNYSGVESPVHHTVLSLAVF